MMDARGADASSATRSTRTAKIYASDMMLYLAESSSRPTQTAAWFAARSRRSRSSGTASLWASVWLIVIIPGALESTERYDRLVALLPSRQRTAPLP